MRAPGPRQLDERVDGHFEILCRRHQCGDLVVRHLVEEPIGGDEQAITCDCSVDGTVDLDIRSHS